MKTKPMTTDPIALTRHIIHALSVASFILIVLHLWKYFRKRKREKGSFTLEVSDLTQVNTLEEMEKLRELYLNHAENETVIVKYVRKEVLSVNTLEEMEKLRELYLKEEAIVFSMTTKTTNDS